MYTHTKNKIGAMGQKNLFQKRSPHKKASNTKVLGGNKIFRTPEFKNSALSIYQIFKKNKKLKSFVTKSPKVYSNNYSHRFCGTTIP